MNPLILLSSATGSIAPPTGVTIGNSAGPSALTSTEDHGNYAYVFSSLSATTPTPVTYQWSMSTDNGVSFFSPAGHPKFLAGFSGVSGGNIVGPSSVSGTVTPGSQIYIAFNGLAYTADQQTFGTPYKFKIVYSNAGGSTTSAIATKNVAAKISGTFANSNAVPNAGNNVMIVTISGTTPLSWEWQYSQNSTGEGWVPVNNYSEFALGHSGDNQFKSSGSTTLISNSGGALNYTSGYSDFVSPLYLFMRSQTVPGATVGSRYRLVPSNPAAQYGYYGVGGNNQWFQLY
jgi:hypothetical protein